MRKTISKYQLLLKDRYFVTHTVTAVLMLIGALAINFYAASYATFQASNHVTDLVLSNIPVFRVTFFFIYGSIYLSLLIAALCLIEPKRIPFVVKSLALFILIRSAFITLTHLGPFPERLLIEEAGIAWRFLGDRLFFTFFAGNDFFFSGHTGIPFLMAFIFWDNRFLRIFFFVASVLFGAVVLMAHLHYTIDVLSAFFISYTIYVIATKAFPNDKKLFSRAS